MIQNSFFKNSYFLLGVIILLPSILFLISISNNISWNSFSQESIIPKTSTSFQNPILETNTMYFDLFEKLEKENPKVSQDIENLLEKLETNSLNDSDKIVLKLDSIFSNYDTIEPSTLALIIHKIDIQSQISSKSMEDILSNLKPNQELSSEIFLSQLYQLIYDEKMFDGSDLDLAAISKVFFNQFKGKEEDYTQSEPKPIFTI